MGNLDDLATKFRSRLTSSSFFLFISYVAANQSFILVNSDRNDVIVISEL